MSHHAEINIIRVTELYLKTKLQRPEVHDFIYGTRTIAAHGTREMPVWGCAFMFRQGALAGPFVTERTPQEVEDKIATSLIM